MNNSKNRGPILRRRALLFVMDAFIVAFCFYLGLLMRADGSTDANWWPHNLALLYKNLPWIVAVYMAVFLAGGLYSILWKYAGERDLVRLGGMIAVSTAVVYLVNRFLIHGVLFNSANVIASILILLVVGGTRLAWRLFLNHPLGERLRGKSSSDPNRPMMIVGAGEAGAWAINVCKSNSVYGRPVVAVDDNPAKWNQTLHGVPVRGPLENIPELCRKYNIYGIIIAIPTLRGSRMNKVMDLCVSTRCKVQILSDPQSIGGGSAPRQAFRELNTADFLSRDEVSLDTAKIEGYVKGRTILVTGGGGSIGSELCRQLMRFSPGRLLIFDVYENCAYELQMELQRKYGREAPITVLIGSIRDKNRVPRRSPQARPPDGGQPRRGGQEQCHGHQKPADQRQRPRGGTAGPAFHRQGRQPHQRHGLHQADLRDADSDLCPEHRHEVRGGPVRQRAGQPRQRNPAV